MANGNKSLPCKRVGKAERRTKTLESVSQNFFYKCWLFSKTFGLFNWNVLKIFYLYVPSHLGTTFGESVLLVQFRFSLKGPTKLHVLGILGYQKFFSEFIMNLWKKSYQRTSLKAIRHNAIVIFWDISFNKSNIIYETVDSHNDLEKKQIILLSN